ncbi:MAG: phosphatase PAP2 family protein [Muribaculaceae bacterium]|nr:phosphatase PAP2 family protein [Muribaculaceae bacterium]
MPIDTSSYYPEVNGPEGEERGSGLNRVRESLFEPEKPKSGVSLALENEELRENELQERGNNSPKSPEKEETSPWENMVQAVSVFLSWALVPILMPVYGILFIFRLSILDVIPANLQTAVTFVIAGINFFAPMLLIFLLKIAGVVQDVGLNGQKERLVPYIITALCYGASAWFVASRGAPVWVSMFFCGGVVASLINMAINFKWKISAHAAAIAGIVALLIRLQRDVAVEPRLFVWLIITVGAAGLLGSARIWMKRHTVWQVLAGYFVGFCSVFFMMYIR